MTDLLSAMDEISECPPHPIKWPLMFQSWERLTFLHWRYPADVIRALIPSELELDTFDGAAWIGLTPFLLTGLRPPFLPALPWISQFPEMNVRTYVRGPNGERGIWFFSLEADRLAAVAGADFLMDCRIDGPICGCGAIRCRSNTRADVTRVAARLTS